MVMQMTKYHIDINKMNIGDSITLLNPGSSIIDHSRIFDKIVSGGFYHLPVSEYFDVMESINKEIEILAGYMSPENKTFEQAFKIAQEKMKNK